MIWHDVIIDIVEKRVAILPRNRQNIVNIIPIDATASCVARPLEAIV